MKRNNVGQLVTEQRNRAAKDLDLQSALRIARIINREDRRIARAFGRALLQIARAIEAIAHGIADGGRLIYVGAGTSGRIAALDASECPPTFGIDPETVQFVIAGGEKALGRASEVSEDSAANGERDIAKLRPTRRDVVVGIAASGRTPYTIAAIEYGRKRGATTVAVVCSHGSKLARAADIAIEIEVGAEVIAGSTRMKAGTAQKMVLNMLSTGAMTRLGYVYGNHMVNVHVKNQKLRERALRILEELARVGRMEAERALHASANNVPVALISLVAQVDPPTAKKHLEQANGNVRRAIDIAKADAAKSSAVGRSRQTHRKMGKRAMRAHG